MVKQYYNAQEAMNKLGVSKTKFYEYVDEQRISKKLEEGRQRGAQFPVKEVDALAAALRGIEITYNPESQQERSFRVARPEDAPEVSRFSKYIFEPLGGYGLDEEIFAEWFKIPYLEIGHLLLDYEKIIGYVTILPLRHDQVMKIMHREVRPSKIPVEKLPRLEPGEPIDLFIVDMAVDPQVKQAVVYLIGKLLAYFEDLGKEGVEIAGIYATASTREGINICRRAGMTQMDVPNIQPNWIPFELKVQETKSSLTKGYLRALTIYKRKRQRASDKGSSRPKEPRT